MTLQEEILNGVTPILVKSTSDEECFQIPKLLIARDFDQKIANSFISWLETVDMHQFLIIMRRFFSEQDANTANVGTRWSNYICNNRKFIECSNKHWKDLKDFIDEHNCGRLHDNDNKSSS